MSDWRERFVKGFKNAFDLGPKGPIEPSPEERETLDRILTVVVRKGMTTPAQLFLESARPMNGVGANALRFFEPMVSAVVDRDALVRLANFLERRGSVDWMCRRLDELANEASSETSAVAEPKDGDARP
ncbi:MAG: hypothetical protein JNM94_18705 [Phycisphaerae bacterium]|nr:hypothetical protein [Phycisphaerae bacterium]